MKLEKFNVILSLLLLIFIAINYFELVDGRRTLLRIRNVSKEHWETNHQYSTKYLGCGPYGREDERMHNMWVDFFDQEMDIHLVRFISGDATIDEYKKSVAESISKLENRCKGKDHG